MRTIGLLLTATLIGLLTTTTASACPFSNCCKAAKHSNGGGSGAQGGGGNAQGGGGEQQNQQAFTGVNEEQILEVDSGTPTAGTFTLTFNGKTTRDIAWNATANDVQSRLEALTNIGTGNIKAAGGPLPATAITIEFVGTLAKKNVDKISVNNSRTDGTYKVSDSRQGSPDIKVTANTKKLDQLVQDVRSLAADVRSMREVMNQQLAVWKSLERDILIARQKYRSRQGTAQIAESRQPERR